VAGSETAAGRVALVDEPAVRVRGIRVVHDDGPETRLVRRPDRVVGGREHGGLVGLRPRVLTRLASQYAGHLAGHLRRREARAGVAAVAGGVVGQALVLADGDDL